MGYERRKVVLHNAIRGWVSYFKYADARNNLIAISKWLNRRIRMCIWKSWKLPRTRVHNLIKCGVPQWRAHQWGNASKGYWAVAGSFMKSQRAIETSREQAIRHCWDTTKSIIVDKEPPYADPHVRWCERSENESRKKTFVFLLLDYFKLKCSLIALKKAVSSMSSHFIFSNV